MAEKLTDNKNIFLTTESERLAVTPHTQHLYKDADAGFLFYGDGSTVGGTSVDVRPATTKTANYTLLRKDEGRLVVFNSGSGVTLTIPTNANVPFVNGLTEIHVLNIGAGAVTLSGASGVTVSGTTSLTQYAKATIRKTGTDAWVVLASVATSTGDIEGVTAGTGLSGGGTSGTVTLTNAGVTSIVAGSNISISGATGAVTITGTDTNTQLTTEQVQDIVGDMLEGTETRIGVSYDDTNGRINFVVDDMTANTQLTTEEVQDIIGAMIAGNTESGITVTYDDTNGKLDLSVASQTDNNFTTTLKNKLDGIEASATADQTAAEIRTLVEAATDSNVFTDADHSKLDGIEASATADQTDEEIQDIVGAMVSSNTETGITVTYQDADGTLDFVVDSQTDENFTTADHAKLDGIAASANNYAISADLLDEDNMASNSATKVASQQSIKAYVDAEVAGVVDSAPAALNTLNELAAALGDDANYATTTSTALGNRLRTDVDSQGLTSTQQGYALTNLGITATKAEINILDDGLSASDIPSLAASKITSGTFATARIADDAITADKLNVSGDGSATQFLRSDGDGSFTWAVPTDTDTNTQLTQEQVEDFVAGVITAGSNVSVTYDDAAGTLTIASTDTNTQLTTEAVQDIVGAMFTGNTETNITATYEDGDGTIDLVSTDTNTQLTTEEVQDIVGAMFTSNTETRITATYQDGDGTIDLVVDDQSSDNNTTYSISAVDGDNADEEKIRLTDSAAGTDDVVLEAGTGLSIARSGDKITFTNTVTDTNTQLTTEQVQDIIGAMVDGGTETNISVTYDDTNGKLNFVSTDTNTTYSVGDGGLTQNNFTNTLKTKLDGIASSANNYVHPNHSGEVTSSADGATVIASNVVDEDNLKATNSPTDNYLLSYDDASGGFTWVAAGSGGENNEYSFKTISVSGQDDVVADTTTDTLTFAAGSNVTITTTAGSDTITFASTDTNTQLTQEQVEDYVNGLIVGGTNVTATYDDAAGTLTLSSADTNTQLSTEEVQDIVGAMLVGTETRIGVTYDDTNGRINFVVDDMTANDNTFRTITAGGNTLGSTETLAFTAGSNVTITESGGAVTIASTDTNTNTQLSQEQVEDYIDGLLTAGSNISLTYDDAAGTLTIASTDTNTQLSTEQVQDIVGAMFSSNTETRISATYQDGDGTIDLVVDDLNTDTQLSTEQVQDIVGAMFTSNTETRVSATYQDGDGTIDLVVDDMTANDNTFRTITAGGNTLGSTETLAFTAGSNVTISESGGAVTIASTDTNTNTQLSDEQVQDIVGAMFSSNTETGIAATYQDGDGTIDLVVGTLNQDTTGTASKVTVSDSTANTNFPVVFHDESNALLDDTGALRYNPSTGTLLVPNLNVAGTTTQVDTVTMEAANAIVFEGATADAYETTLTITDPTADRTVTIPNASFTIPTQDTTYSVGDGGLTQNNFTNTLKTKLDGIASSANNYALTDDLAAGEITQLQNIGSTSISATQWGYLGAASGAITNTDTQLTTEQVQDIVGAMFTSNTETRISATYEDGDGTIDLVVDDMTADTNTNQLTTFTLTGDSGTNQTIAHGNTLDIAGGTGIDTVVGNTDTVTVAIDSTVATLSGSQTLSNKTIAISQVTELSNLTAAEGEQLENIGSTTISATQWGYLGAASGAITNTDTQLSTEQVQDIVGAMFTSNTETRISATYEDGDGTIDLVVDDMTANTNTQNEYATSWVDSSNDVLLRLTESGAGSGTQDIKLVAGSNITLTPSGTNMTIAATDTNTTYSVGDGGLTENDFTDALKSKLDGIEASATADQTKSDINGLAITTVGTIDSGTWQGTAIAGGYIANDAIDSQHYADGSIDTAHIADNQVTLAKMAGITRGSIIIGNASGDPAALAVGSNGQVLTSDGTDISWGAASGGASALNGLTDVISNITNFTDSILISPDGAAPPHGTLSSATDNVGIGKDAFAALTSGDYNIAIGSNSLNDLTSGGSNVAIGGWGALEKLTTQSGNVAIGGSAGRYITNGGNNTFVGNNAGTGNSGGVAASSNVGIGNGAMYAINGVANNNVGIGEYALRDGLTSGDDNIAIGTSAGRNVSSASDLIFIGNEAGYANTTGERNIAIGYKAYDNADTESDNIAIGYDALGGAVNGAEKTIAIGNYTLDALTSGDNNVAIGYSAGSALTTQGSNTMIGFEAGTSSTSVESTYIGYYAGRNNLSNYNVAIGAEAMITYGDKTAERNTAIGTAALKVIETGDRNTSVGGYSGIAVTTGSDNVFLGYQAGNNITTGSNNVVIGAADVSSATGDDQLSISSGDGGVTWITGDSNGGIASKAQVVAVTGNTTLTEAQSGSYVYWTAGSCTLPTSATVGTQFTIFNNTGSSATVGLGTNNSIVSGGASNAAVADNDSTSYICVSSTNWWQVG